MKKATWFALGAMAMLAIVILVACIGGADYSLLKPSPESMAQNSTIVYLGEMPCLIFIGTTGDASDTFAWGSCDWSKYDETLASRYGIPVIHLKP